MDHWLVLTVFYHAPWACPNRPQDAGTKGQSRHAATTTRILPYRRVVYRSYAPRPWAHTR